MNSIKNILEQVEGNIKTEQERVYFWTHTVRYQFIIEQVQEIANENTLRVLDIGCFPYHVGAVLELLGHNVYGIASNHEPIKNKQIVIVNIEKEKFPYKDNFFDLVLFNEVVEHLPQSPIPPLQEIYRVTKKGGAMFVTTPNITRSINRGKLILGKSILYPIDVYFEENGLGNNIYHRHNREYTLSELAAIVQKMGWKITKQQYFISYTPFRKRAVPDPLWLFMGKYLNYLLMLLIPSFRDNLFVVGKK